MPCYAVPCCAVLCLAALCLSGGTPRLFTDLGSWSSLRVRWADESQQSRQGDKVGPKARGRVADATVATTTTPVGEAKDKRETPGSTRRGEALWLFLGGAGRLRQGLRPNHLGLTAGGRGRDVL